MLAVLRVLYEEAPGELWGYEISKRSHGVGSGTLYPILDRLEQDGWLVGRWEVVDESAEGRPRRRYFRLTGLGVAAARDLLERRPVLIFGDQPISRAPAG